MSVVGDFAYNLLQRHPEAVPLVTGIVQRVRPILRLGSSILVMRDADVREVLERRDDFELGHPNGPKLRDVLGGDFLLGMDPSAQYEREKERLRTVLQGLMRDFPTLVEEECQAAAASLLPANPEPGTRVWIDVVSQYAERITTRVASRFYGIPFEGAKSAVLRGSSEDVMRFWMRKLGSVIASPWPAPFGLRRIAESCREELFAHFEKHVEALEDAAGPARRGGSRGKDVLSRLLAGSAVRGGSRSPDLDFVWRNVVGLMLAGSAAIAKSFTHVVAQLHQRPEFFEMAVKAARTNDGGTLRALALEAMRFNPTFLVLPRYCPRDTTLAARTPRECQVPAGATLYCVTLSAMFDSEAVPQPDVFRPGRAYPYLHFGAGEHWCIGQEIDIAMAQLERMLLHFLKLECFEPADPRRIKRKRIVYDGPAVDRLWLRVPL